MKLIYKLTFFAILSGMFFIACDSESPGGSNGSSGKGGSMARFTISGNVLYTVSEYELNIFDISNAENPMKTSDLPINGFAETIFAKDSLLFFGTRQGMIMYSIKDKLNPVYTSTYSHIYSCDPVVVQGNYAYVTLNSESFWCGRNNNRLDVVDISDVYNPVPVAEYSMTSPKGLGVDGNTLFLCDKSLKVYNIEKPDSIYLVKSFSNDAYDVIPDDGNLLLIGSDGLFQYKYLAEESQIKFLSSILTNNKD